MPVEQVLAYIQAAQVLIAAGVALGSELKDVAVKLVQMFRAKPMTDEELNVFITAVQAKAAEIKAQADADVAQAQADQQSGTKPPAA